MTFAPASARVLAASLTLLALAASACEDPPPKASRPSDTPEVASAAPAPWPTLRMGGARSSLPEAASPPSAIASAAPPTSADPSSTGSAAASSAHAGAASAGAAASGSPSASAAADAAGAPPNPKTGILAKGVADKILKLGAPPKVRLVEPGEEPRAVMGYTLTKGMKQPLRVSQETTIAMKSAEGSAPSTPGPRLSTTFDLTAGENDPSGDWKIDAILRGIDVEPKGAAQEAQAAKLRPLLTGVKGMSMSYWMSPIGVVRDVKVNLSGDAPAPAQEMVTSMNQAFQLMVVPMPKEEIGIGAKWEVVTRAVNLGADVLQYATYTLKSRDGSKAVLDVALKQLAANASVKMPWVPAGISTRVRSFKWGGAGAQTVDTKQLATDSGTLAIKTVMDMQVTEAAVASSGLPGERTQSMTVETSVTMSFSRP
jgi:hypothetical protein